MNYYIDIKLNPNDEMRENVLLNKVYTEFHKALFTLNATTIGVSFPTFRVKLGGVIRLHGTKEELSVLQNLNWLSELSKHCDVTECLPIPEKVKHRIVSRKQSNMTEAKLRRLIKRGSISTEEAKQYKAKMFSKGLDNPYLELESSSNGNKYRRYIQFSKLLDSPVKGEFDSFGLSKEATIPWF